MRKITLLPIIILIACIILTACADTALTPTPFVAVNNLEGVTMTVKADTVTADGLTVSFFNNSQTDCMYGEYYVLEKSNGNQWFTAEVAISENYSFESIGYLLESTKTSELVVDWKWLYGSLPAGHYRIVKLIDDYALAAEFDIG